MLSHLAGVSISLRVWELLGVSVVWGELATSTTLPPPTHSHYLFWLLLSVPLFAPLLSQFHLLHTYTHTPYIQFRAIKPSLSSFPFSRIYNPLSFRYVSSTSSLWWMVARIFRWMRSIRPEFSGGLGFDNWFLVLVLKGLLFAISFLSLTNLLSC